MEKIVQLGKCLSDPFSIRILNLLLEDDLEMSQLQRIVVADRQKVDVRLSRMRELKLVTIERSGRFLVFRVQADVRPMLKDLFLHLDANYEWHEDLTRDLFRLRGEPAIRR